MVCLYGITLDLVEENLTDNEKKEYPTWSWLTFRLTEYIYNLDPQSSGEPIAPAEHENTIYAKWFHNVVTHLKKTFNDATPVIVLRCLNNTPAEEVSLLVFESTDMKLIHRFRAHLSTNA